MIEVVELHNWLKGSANIKSNKSRNRKFNVHKQINIKFYDTSKVELFLFFLSTNISYQKRVSPLIIFHEFEIDIRRDKGTV